ncbi:MBL fold metallo-hydrolase [Parasphaerochaeta coccoides]|nr:MBL fold metallo-hydrolase [Parasphaerochaeta coccoides]
MGFPLAGSCDYYHRMNMMRYAVLGSGSSGNSYVFFDGENAILVDCGFSLRELKKRLDNVGVPLEAVRKVFLTHLHPDHACGIGVLTRNLPVPLVVGREAVAGETVVWSKLRVPEKSVLLVSEGETVDVGEFSVWGFKTTHDSRGSMGWIIDHGRGSRFMVLTDTGAWTEDMAKEALSADVLFLEANYDERMLHCGPYPLRLQKRIEGAWGHLSNTQAFDFLRRSGHIVTTQNNLAPRERRVYFIHLSVVNNSPGLLAEQAGGQMWNMTSFTVCERGKIYSDELACPL